MKRKKENNVVLPNKLVNEYREVFTTAQKNKVIEYAPNTRQVKIVRALISAIDISHPEKNVFLIPKETLWDFMRPDTTLELAPTYKYQTLAYDMRMLYNLEYKPIHSTTSKSIDGFIKRIYWSEKDAKNSLMENQIQEFGTKYVYVEIKEEWMPFLCEFKNTTRYKLSTIKNLKDYEIWLYEYLRANHFKGQGENKGNVVIVIDRWKDKLNSNIKDNRRWINYYIRDAIKTINRLTDIDAVEVGKVIGSDHSIEKLIYKVTIKTVTDSEEKQPDGILSFENKNEDVKKEFIESGNRVVDTNQDVAQNYFLDFLKKNGGNK